ncbi:MAG: protein phosphatase 2C domain-containing protein [Firmicutes bacterium]|nr:protein phosphatase 2C domain-containing protein [Bacillota bacterium]
MKNNIWIPFGESVTGASHARKEPPYDVNQDALAFHRGEFSENGIMPTVVAVSDGHGGRPYIRSEMGSKFAVEAICTVAKRMKGIGNYFNSDTEKNYRISQFEDAVAHIKAQIFKIWKESVNNDIQKLPSIWTENEKANLEKYCSSQEYADVMEEPLLAYGCTLLAVIAYSELVLILQLGDGDILGLNEDGSVTDLTIADERNFGGGTMSLCTLKNAAEIQHKILIGNDIPALIAVSTDGIVNSFDDRLPQNENGFYQIPTEIKTHLKNNDFDTKKVGAILQESLKNITTNGSADDVTLGILFDTDKIMSMVDNIVEEVDIANVESPTEPLESAKIGEIVSFSGYNWQVLDIQDNQILLLSQFILEKRAYHDAKTSITWENCTLRHYLNNDFYNSLIDKDKIITKNLFNYDNQWSKISGGDKTTDNIFLLSLEEVVQYFGDSGKLKNRSFLLSKINDEFNEKRISKTASGVAESWWLRSPGFEKRTAVSIMPNGKINVYGYYVSSNNGVRPALWLQL